MMGLEEHLLAMFREDPEFHDGAAPSHLGGAAVEPIQASAREPAATAFPGPVAIGQPEAIWSAEAEKELKKIPFFVRGRARGNTETFARELGLATITVNTLYEAKAHFGR
jgi:light-independent protochlorophyllide reductase subunit B